MTVGSDRPVWWLTPADQPMTIRVVESSTAGPGEPGSSQRPTTVISGGRVLTPDGWAARELLLAEGRVASIGSGRAPARSRSIDASGLLVAPGFVDIQINGGHGLDLASDPTSLWSLAELLPQHGVTSFLPTIVTSPAPTVDAALAALSSRPDGFLGAEPLGLHLEGPMLNPERRGAHRSDLLRSPSLELIEGWSRTAGVVLVTLAPELPGAGEVITELVARRIVVSAGHTVASADELAAGRRAGVTLVTHLFNAMTPLGHRDPGVVGTVLADRVLVAGLIVDGIHVDPLVVRAAWNAKGPLGIVLVTDAVAAMGRGPGRFEFSGRELTSSESGVRNAEGRLAGSALTMDQAVRNLVAFTGCEDHQAIRAASTLPAAVVGLDGKGRIEVGGDADLVLLDLALGVVATLVGGEMVYRRPGVALVG